MTADTTTFHSAAPLGVPCMIMRGGTSKGLYFLASDLPSDPGARNALLLEIMGSPDARQIDGLGGATTLTSKVAVVSPAGAGHDVDYLFLQLGVDQATVSEKQNCGNILAGVGPFAVERGLVAASGEQARVRIRMVNTDSFATAVFPLIGGVPDYRGQTMISGVPFPGARVDLDFEDIAGSSTGALLPTGRPVDVIDGIEVTLIDNGMPVVVLAAADLGVSGREAPGTLEDDTVLRERVERLRLEAGRLMNLGDVSHTTVPKMVLVSPPTAGGTVSTRSFIPHRVHAAIGVLAAVSVATATLIPGTPAAALAQTPTTPAEAAPGSPAPIVIEHPTGTFSAIVDADWGAGGLEIRRAGIVRTARKLMDGTAFGR
ncbi:4-oxalomesaconate tautomerase [Brevibacterium metallidurans]|uniref:4-oxalomesaconate tautomerase n=1 Tax=Brevibacterium metallidurans TaxID=1482676 RepID=A0ABP3CBL3_9MICO